jgi:hypothetical protein
MSGLSLKARETQQLVAILGDGLIRVITPGALRAVGLHDQACELATLPALTTEMVTTPGALDQCAQATRRAHTAVLGLHRQTVEVLGSDRCRMTDADLLAYTGATEWIDPHNAWGWVRGPKFTSPAAALAYATWIRCLGVLHLWERTERATDLGKQCDAAVNALSTRAFLECDEAFMLPPDQLLLA